MLSTTSDLLYRRVGTEQRLQLIPNVPAQNDCNQEEDYPAFSLSTFRTNEERFFYG